MMWRRRRRRRSAAWGKRFWDGEELFWEGRTRSRRVRQKETGQYDDQDKFAKQCRKWWTDLPTPYRREYWAREQEYRRSVSQSAQLSHPSLVQES